MAAWSEVVTLVRVLTMLRLDCITVKLVVVVVVAIVVSVTLVPWVKSLSWVPVNLTLEDRWLNLCAFVLLTFLNLVWIRWLFLVIRWISICPLVTLSLDSPAESVYYYCSDSG